VRVSKPFPPTALLALVLCHPAMAQTLPSGGTVVSGAANIQQSGASQTVTQASQKAIINWQNFSIGAGGSVNFVQPNSSSVVLNRVLGSARSDIYGRLTANGQVFIVNPNGVYFGAGSAVDVGGLLATTLNIGDDDFLSGNYVFSRGSLDAARRDVINEGVLKARDKGYVILAGDYAANRGIVQAKLGTAALASGSKMTLDVQGDNLINFAVNEKTVAQLSGVENSGQLLADGGRAIMTAAVATDLQTAVVNNTGLVRANSAEERNGEIILSADGGNTLNSGTLDASGKAAGQTGGNIEVLGDKVALTDDALLDASGDAGGGNINIGGNYQGKGPLKNAQTSYVGQNVQIKADASGSGNGGKVVVWSDDWTRYYGSISAQGGAQGGDGGSVEVSGKQLLDFNGKVDTLAANGKAGTLLLDPADIEIINSSAVSGGTPTSDMSPSSAPTSAGNTVFKDASDNGGTSSQMAVGVLEDALQQGNVTVQTSTTSGTAPKGGTITIDDGSGNGVQWSAATQLHLKADNQIVIKSDVQGSSSGSSLWLEAANGATQNSNTNLKAGSLLLTDGASGTGNWTLVGKGNNFNTFAANLSTAGTLQFRNNQGMTVGSVTEWDGGTTVNGIQHANGDTQLDIDGALVLAKDVNSKQLYTNAGSLTQQAGEKVTGDSLFMTGGNVTLTNSGNNFNTISALLLSGSLNYTDADSLTVGAGRSGINGIWTNNKDVTIRTGNSATFTDLSQQPTAGTASLVLNESISAGLATVRLTTGSGGIYQRHDTDGNGAVPNGSITANALLVQGNNSTNVTPFVLTNADNRVNTFAAKANGSISFAGAASNSSHTLTIGTIDGVKGITTTSNTIVSTTPNADGTTTTSTNENNISLSIGGNLNIDQNLTASTAEGSDTVSIGIGGDYTARTASGIRVTADTMGVFGDDMQGTFGIVSNVQNLAAAGGKLMVIDNTAYTGALAGIGIGASATSVSATNGDSTVTVDSSDKPVGDFYLATGGALNIIKLNSKGQNLMLRSTSLSILLEAITADNARIMLQPLNPASTIGINNSSQPGWTPGINYDANTLLKFSNPVATFYFGTPSNAIINDLNVPLFAKNFSTGDIHIGYDGAFNLGYRSLSAQTSGNLIAYNVGPLYNLRLAAPNLTIHKFETFGDQIHLFSNNLSLPGTTSDYVNQYKPTITYRSLTDETIWVGHSYVANEPQILPSTLVKLPDGSTIIISGSTDYPFPNGGHGYGDIHIPWDDGIVLLGNRKLVFSTGHKIYDYNATPVHTERGSNVGNSDGGTSGGLWQGCQNLTTCAGTNPSPYPDPGSGTTTTDTGDNSGGSDGSGDGNTGCQSCTPAPPNTNPYPPDTTTGNNNNGNGNGSNGDNTNSSGTGDNGNGMNTDGAGDDGSSLGDGGSGDGDNGAGTGDNSSANNGDGSGDGGAGIGNGGDSSGDNGSGLGDGGSGDGDNSAGTGDDSSANNGDGGGDGGAGIGNGGDSSGDNGSGLGDGGSGDGDNGAGISDDGSGNNGDGSGDGGASMGSGGDGGGDNGNGLGNGGDGSGDNGNGLGDGGNGDGDNGAGTGGAGSGDAGDGSGDAGAGTGSGGTGDGGDGNGLGNGDGGDGGSGTGSGDNGNGDGDAGAGDGSGGTADGANGRGDGDDGNGLGDDNAGNGGTRDTADGDGDGGAGSGSGGLSDGTASGGDGNGAAGTGDGDDRQGNGAQGDGDGDGQSGSNDGSESSSANATTAFSISCEDIAQAKDRKSSDRKGGKELVEIRQQGLKLQDPCQQQPNPDKRK